VPFEFVEESCEIEIKDGNVIMRWPNGERRSIPLRVFRITHARAEKALRAYDARKGEVVPIKRGRRGGHAASP
jgi:hypothetical protein